MYAVDALSSYIYSADEKRLKVQSAPIFLWPRSLLCLTTTEVSDYTKGVVSMYRHKVKNKNSE